MMEWKKIEELEGFTMRSVVRDEDLSGQGLADAPWRWLDKGDNLTFTREDGRKFMFFHLQDCCESVVIEDVCGDLNDLVGSPLIRAEERWERAEESGCDGETWTFYEFATIKGAVTVRWCGSSNGYYSESVDFSEVVPCDSLQ